MYLWAFMYPVVRSPKVDRRVAITEVVITTNLIIVADTISRLLMKVTDQVILVLFLNLCP